MCRLLSPECRQKWLAVVDLRETAKVKTDRKLGRTSKYEVKTVLWNPHHVNRQLLVSAVSHRAICTPHVGHWYYFHPLASRSTHKHPIIYKSLFLLSPFFTLLSLSPSSVCVLVQSQQKLELWNVVAERNTLVHSFKAHSRPVRYIPTTPHSLLPSLILPSLPVITVSIMSSPAPPSTHTHTAMLVGHSQTPTSLPPVQWTLSSMCGT